MTEILYGHLDCQLPEETWKEYLHRIPRLLQDRIRRYRRWQDRQIVLLGKLLLMEGLKSFGYSVHSIDELLSDEKGRPFLNQKVDFNISHSGEYAVCVLSEKGRVGIDIEKVREIDLSDFKKYLSFREWETLEKSERRYEDFFDIWTAKESVLKADGRGLLVPFDHVQMHGEKAFLDESIYFVTKIEISPEYRCHGAFNFEEFKALVRKVHF